MEVVEDLAFVLPVTYLAWQRNRLREGTTDERGLLWRMFAAKETSDALSEDELVNTIGTL